MHGKRDTCIQNFVEKIPMKQTTSKTGLAINENIIKIDLKTVGSEGVD
jgi:hypothetical protein